MRAFPLVLLTLLDLNAAGNQKNRKVLYVRVRKVRKEISWR